MDTLYFEVEVDDTQWKRCNSWYEWRPRSRTAWGTCPVKEQGQNAACWACCFNKKLLKETDLFTALTEGQRWELAFREATRAGWVAGRNSNPLAKSLGVISSPYGQELYYAHVMASVGAQVEICPPTNSQ